MNRFRRAAVFVMGSLSLAAWAAFNPAQKSLAQTMTLGALVEGRNYYNGYGIQDYGGYGFPGDKYNGFGHPFGVSDFSYSGYGNGPYGAGAGSEHEFLSNNRYSHGDAVYDGYGSLGYYGGWSKPQRYNPYGYGVPSWRHHDW